MIVIQHIFFGVLVGRDNIPSLSKQMPRNSGLLMHIIVPGCLAANNVLFMFSFVLF